MDVQRGTMDDESERFRGKGAADTVSEKVKCDICSGM